MMTPEQVKQLFTDSLKHEHFSEDAIVSSLARCGIFTPPTDHLLTEAQFDEWRGLQKQAERYIQHVKSLPNGASQLLEKYGIDLSNNREGKKVSRASGSVRGYLSALQMKVTKSISEAPKRFQEKYKAERNPWYQLYNISNELRTLQRLIEEKPSSVDYGKVEDLERKLERALGELGNSNSTRSSNLLL